MEIKVNTFLRKNQRFLKLNFLILGMLNNLQSSALCINRHHRTKPPASIKPAGEKAIYVVF